MFKMFKWLDKPTEKYATDMVVYLRKLDMQTKQLIKENEEQLEQWRKEQSKLWIGE